MIKLTSRNRETDTQMANPEPPSLLTGALASQLWSGWRQFAAAGGPQGPQGLGANLVLPLSSPDAGSTPPSPQMTTKFQHLGLNKPYLWI